MKAILWLDDERDVLESQRPAFDNHDFVVHAAHTVSEALRVLRSVSLDGVLLDVRLAGGEDGLKLLENIRHSHPDLPVVVLTQYFEPSAAVKAKAHGAVYLPKSALLTNDSLKVEDFFEALGRAFAAPQKGSMRLPSGKALEVLWVPVILLLLGGLGWLVSRYFENRAKPGILVGHLGKPFGGGAIYVDNDLAPVMADSLTGFFRREVSPGTHQLRYVVPGFKPAAQAIRVKGGAENRVVPPGLEPLTSHPSSHP